MKIERMLMHAGFLAFITLYIITGSSLTAYLSLVTAVVNLGILVIERGRK